MTSVNALKISKGTTQIKERKKKFSHKLFMKLTEKIGKERKDLAKISETNRMQENLSTGTNTVLKF